MTASLSGIRGRVTFTVFAVTAVLYSVLGTVGFLAMADSGRAAIRDRVEEVLDQLEFGIRSGSGAVTLSTSDGIDAFAAFGDQPPAPAAGTVQVTRQIRINGVDLWLTGRSSEVRLTESLRSLYRSLWLAIPLAAAVSAAMAGLATRRALAPVGSITTLAASIGATDTSARVPVPDTGDEVALLASTFNDMLDRVDEGRRAQRQFTSDAAHELRTPLMALQGELELIANGTQQLDPATLDRLVALGSRLGDRIDDLVLLSTLDEHRPLALDDVDLVELTRAEAGLLAPGATVTGHAPSVTADRALVARAVRNLLANATRHRADAVQATIEQTGALVWLHIDDDGPGIPPDAVDRIFGRFTRLDPARSTREGGAGLGLAIVAAVAAAHGGRVDATTSPLGGARLSLALPLPT